MLKNIKLSITKEFVLFAIGFAILISILIYSPYHLNQIANVILENSNRNYETVLKFENQSEIERKRLGEEVIGILLLYLIDIEEDLDRDLRGHGYTQGDKIKINDTHITLSDNRTIEIPHYVDVIASNITQ